MGGLFSDDSFRSALRGSLAVVLVIAGVFLTILAWPVIQPLLVAIVLATALWPWVSRITSYPIGPRRWRMPRVVATALIYLAALASAALVTWALLSALIPQLDRVMQAFPQYTSGLREYLEPLRSGNVAESAARVAEDVANGTSAPGGDGPQLPADQQQGGVNVAAVAIILLGGIVNVMLVLVFTFFLLLEGDRIAQGFLLALPRERRINARRLGMSIRNNVSRWVIAVGTYAAISAAVVTAGMWAIQMPSPWMYGLFAALLAVVPGVGPAASLIPGIFVALDLSDWQPLAVGAFAAAAYALDGTVLVPKLFGDILRLPMVVVVASTLVGAVLMGVWGALIGPMVAVVAQMVIRDLLGREIEPEAEKPVPMKQRESA